MIDSTIKNIAKSGPGLPWSGLGLILLAVSLSTGCASMQLGIPVAPPEQETVAQSGPMYQLEMKSTMGRTTVQRAPIEGAMTVQDALESSGALQKYRNMDITLSRIVEGSKQVLRLPVAYDPSEDHVLPEQNYALHPGDTISIGPRTSGSIESMIDSMTGGAL